MADHVTMPKISILMSVYNGEPYLREALNSILAQTYPDFEFIIVDDASTDRTPRILNTYDKKDARIRVVRNRKNQRLAGSLNRGLVMCRAPLIARADADDVYRPDRLEKQFEFMSRHPEIGVLSCAVRQIDAEGEPLEVEQFPTEHEAIRFQMMFTPPIRHPGVMYRRCLVEEVGGYDENMNRGQDYDLWSRLLPRTRFANLSEVLMDYRVHEGMATKNRTKHDYEQTDAVSSRLLSSYLNKNITVSDARAIRRLLLRRWGALEASTVQTGLKLARNIYYHACKCEPQTVVDDYRKKVAEGLFYHAQSQACQTAGEKLGARLWLRALRFYPSVEILPAAVRSGRIVLRNALIPDYVKSLLSLTR